MRSGARRVAGGGWRVAFVFLLAACGPADGNRTVLRMWGDRYAYRVTSEPMPPHSLEPTRFRIVVLDKNTNQPVQQGEGRIFATNKDGASTNDGLAKGAEVGTYYGRLFFPVSGDWAMAIQFRRDSTHRLERVDWMQTVLSERAPGEERQ